MIDNFPAVFSANSGQEPHSYSGIWSQNPVEILGLGHGRNSWSAHPRVTQKWNVAHGLILDGGNKHSSSCLSSALLVTFLCLKSEEVN